MKKYILGSILAMCVVLSGCSTVTTIVEDLTPTQSIIAKLAIQAATTSVINNNSDSVAETAAEIVSIASEALDLIDVGSATLIDDIYVKVSERIDELNLSPEKQLLANALVSMVKLKIEENIDGNILDETTVVTVEGVLQVIIDQAKLYA